MSWRRVLLAVVFAVLATVLGSIRQLGLGALVWPGRVAGELLGVSWGDWSPSPQAVWLTIYTQLFALALLSEGIRILRNRLRRMPNIATSTGYDSGSRPRMTNDLPGNVECIEPILRVEDMSASVRYYVDVLGFKNAAWGSDSFTHVTRNGRGIYLCRGGQGHPGAWVWIGVDDVRALYRVYKDRGAIVRQEPKNESYAVEMQIEDPDGNVLRFGSDPDDAG